MWQQTLGQFLSAEEAQAFREQVQGKSRGESLEKQFANLLRCIHRKGYTAADLLDCVVKHTLGSRNFDGCFEHAFYPLRQRDYKCDYCLSTFGKHIQLYPCKHRMCEDCVQQHKFYDLRCPVCRTYLTDVFVDRQLIQRQMQAEVQCVHCQMFKSASYGECRLLFERYLDSELQAVIDSFNASKIDHNFLGQMRNDLLLADYDAINHVVCGQNYLIQTISFSLLYKVYSIEPCPALVIYRDIYQHLDGHCSHTMRQCPHEGCEQMCALHVLELHASLCRHRLLSCPVCYQRVKIDDFNEHVKRCVRKLAVVVSKPLEIVPDVELLYKMRSVQLAVRDLTAKVQRWDNVVQKQVIDALVSYSAPEDKMIVSSRAAKVLKFLYQDHILLVNFLTQLGTLTLLDLAQQYYPLQRPYWAIGMCVFYFVNLFLFLYYEASFVFSNQYRSALAGQMFAAYYVGIVDCGMIYTLLQFTDNKSIQIHRSSVVKTFIDLFYYASVVGSSIGFGDVVSGTLFVKIVTVIEIYYTQLICKMVFRGLSFYIKQHDLEENRI